jgi:hypothetical protein
MIAEMQAAKQELAAPAARVAGEGRRIACPTKRHGRRRPTDPVGAPSHFFMSLVD